MNLAPAAVAAELEGARDRTLALLAPVDEPDLLRQHSPLMSPLVWDLAHVGNYEDQWLLRALGADGVGPQHDAVYDAFRHPRKERPTLPMLPPAPARAYLAEVRARVLDSLDRMGGSGADSPLLGGGFVYGMVVQHEHQHAETMLATLQLRGVPYPPAAAGATAVAAVPVDGEVLVPAGPFVMGTSTDPWAYDNEQPAHVVDLPAFFIDRAPVTNARYREFVADGGYASERWWSAEGWAWRQEAGLERPKSWSPDCAARVRFGFVEPLPPDEPVQHVCFHEAEAYARWVGKRLPTEAEWEKAASWDEAAGRKRRFPWGDSPGDLPANLGQRRFGPSPVGAHPEGASPSGCLAMVGDVWEWTSTSFDGYPGFRSFPYREYSEVFFGADYKVLRGGSWATHPTAVRTTFRNWDYPIRRQIFAGFRCARDAG